MIENDVVIYALWNSHPKIKGIKSGVLVAISESGIEIFDDLGLNKICGDMNRPE